MPHLFDDAALSRHLLKIQGQLAPIKPAPKQHREKLPVATGNVSMFNREKGFGFAVRSDTEAPDVFIGRKNLDKAGIYELARGDRLAFDVIESKKFPGKFEAIRIRRADLGEAAQAA
jgi:cold shock CspA family protein